MHNIRFLPLLIIAILVKILAQAAHETGHHMIYHVMGHEPVWAFTKFVQLSESTPTNPVKWTEKTYPDGTTNWQKVSSLPSNIIDEAITAAAGPLAGLLSATLGFVACLVLGLCLLPSWGVRLKWLGTVLLGSITTGLPMALLDPIIIAQVDAGNPWFQPLFGYSLPVFLTIVIPLFGVWAWSCWQDGISHEENS